MNHNDMVFICGSLRSGSSLMHLMLDHHPEIKNPGEFDFLFDQVVGDGVFPSIVTYQEWLSTHRIFHSHSLSINNLLSYPELIRPFIEHLPLAADQTLKQPLNLATGGGQAILIVSAWAPMTLQPAAYHLEFH